MMKHVKERRLLCAFALTALLLLGIFAYIIQSSRRISSKAARYTLHNDGLTTFQDNETFHYWIDSTKIDLDNCRSSATSGDLTIETYDGAKSIVLKNGVHTPETQSGYMDLGGILLDRRLGTWQTPDGQSYNCYEGNITGSATVRFKDAAVKYDGSRYDLKMELSDIKAAIRYGHIASYKPILFKNGFCGGWRPEDSRNSVVGFQYEVNLSVVGAEEDESVIHTFYDLDATALTGGSNFQRHDLGPDFYQEGISPLSGYSGNIYLSPDSNIEYKECPEHGQIELYGNQGNDDVNNPDAAVTFLGNARHFTFRFGGSDCVTSLGITEGSGIFQYVWADVYVKWQQADGHWTPGERQVRKKLIYGSAFSWTFGSDYSDSWCYMNPADKTVKGSNIREDKTYTIYVPRRTYTYSFDFETYCPDGHSVSDIGERQGAFNKLADNLSKSIDELKTPSLSGYKFLGFYDSDGNPYEKERMRSDKTFYAKWKQNAYTVHYDGNGATDFDRQTGEYRQNTVAGSMDDSIYEYDVKGKLRKNAYVREGFVFTGWGTNKMGSVRYTDEQDVMNLAGTKAEITLYAQWKKKLGSETITVVSEETGHPVEGVTLRLQKKMNGTWENTSELYTTRQDGSVQASNLPWFDYRWKMVSVPPGYMTDAEATGPGMTDTITGAPHCYLMKPVLSFTVRPCGRCGKSACNSLTKTNRVILYMKHVNLTINSEVDHIIEGETPPSFLYHVNGMDVAGVKHEYNIMVNVNEDQKGTGRLVHDIFAGSYDITQIPVARYDIGSAQNMTNAVVDGFRVTMNLIRESNGTVTFVHKIRNYNGLYGVDGKRNRLRNG